jgi:uncharacterized protein (TIGR02246 family)
MSNRSDGGAGAVVAVGAVALLLLLLAVGGGAYVFLARQNAIALQVEQARLAEADAIAQADLARVTRLIDAAQAQNVEASSAIEAVLNTQQEAWNRGDIDAFMEHYWKSGDLTFSSGGETTRGWNETLARYRERYSTPEKMGRLKLSDFEITTLGESAALVLGEWRVERDDEPLAGNFSLVLRKMDGRWVIVHDHTSRRVE